MKLKFYGAAETVTGSCYYLETESLKFLVDCGMFQGPEVEQRNYEPFDFDPAQLDFVILTHAHIDHSGLLPKLAKHGFKGVIYLTPSTAALTRILLLDAAKIQEKNSQFQFGPAKKPLIYDTNDSLNIIDNFVSINLFEKVKLDAKSSFYFIPAGHILGAASVCVDLDGTRLIFSGDLGRSEQSLIKNFLEQEIPVFDPHYIISESLYGDTIHESREKTAQEFINIVNDTVRRNGNVIIPCFALHRTQELIEILKFAFMVKEINENVQTILDSPMGISITEVYTQFAELFNSRYILGNLGVSFDGDKLEDNYLYKFYLANVERLRFDNLRFNRKGKKSLKLLNKNGNIIIAGSGMANGGRIVHHLYNGLENDKNTVVFVGYQAVETLGREIVEGAKEVLINDKLVKVKAKIEYLRGFSAHADQNDLQLWLNKVKADSLKKVFLIHAELPVAIIYRDLLKSKGYDAVVPGFKQEYIL